VLNTCFFAQANASSLLKEINAHGMEMKWCICKWKAHAKFVAFITESRLWC